MTVTDGKRLTTNVTSARGLTSHVLLLHGLEEPPAQRVRLRVAHVRHRVDHWTGHLLRPGYPSDDHSGEPTQQDSPSELAV